MSPRSVSWFTEKDWYRVKHRVLLRDSVCINGRAVPRCRKTGLYLVGRPPANNSPIVVHIKPPGKDRNLFFDPNNLMTVSRAWHFAQVQDRQTTRSTQDKLFEPDDLAPSKPPLIIVSGPPASGKSTYVRAHAGPDDVVVDMDREAARLGMDRFTVDPADVRRLIAARNDRLRELATSEAPRAWFTFVAPRAETRASFARQLRPEQVIVMFTPAEECLRRIRESRPEAGEDMCKAVIRWHEQYTAGFGEIVIT